jgi:hypothetical protein
MVGDVEAAADERPACWQVTGQHWEESSSYDDTKQGLSGPRIHPASAGKIAAFAEVSRLYRRYERGAA